MEIRFSEEEEAFRVELKEFLERELPPEKRRDRDLAVVAMTEEEWEYARAFEQKLVQKGWLCMHWPKEYGGQDAPLMKQIVYQEEMAYYGALSGGGMGVTIVGPAIMAHGSENHKKQFLSAIARAEAIWCQGFSEPDAGSDLASLKTTARKEADGYVINGTKIWSSGAHHADWCWLLARTDPEAPNHKGISTFAVDMKTPGITIRPLVNMLNTAHFCQIHFDNVWLDKDALVGEENRGWYQAMTTLSFERSGYSRVAALKPILDLLVEYVKARPAGHNPTLRHQLAQLAIELETARLLCYRVAWQQSKGIKPEAEASMARVFGCELSQRFAKVGMEILGLQGLLVEDNDAPFDGLIGRRYLASIANTIMAGTSETQRNIIAQRGLGLPRG